MSSKHRQAEKLPIAVVVRINHENVLANKFYCTSSTVKNFKEELQKRYFQAFKEILYFDRQLNHYVPLNDKNFSGKIVVGTNILVKSGKNKGRFQKKRKIRFMDAVLGTQRFLTPTEPDYESICNINKKFQFKKWMGDSRSLIAQATLYSTPVAVKFFTNSISFEREKEALKTLSSCFHVIPLVDEIELEKHLCFGLVFPLYEQDFIPRDAEELISYMIQLLEAISSIHSAGWIHRDIKPQNIFHQRNGSKLEIILGDFGLAISDFHAATIDERGGTAAYMAPEIASVFRDYSFEVDMWSAGVVFTELLFGKRPFEAEVVREVYECHDAFLENKEEYFDKLGTPRFPELWKKGKEMIFKMLEFRCESRLTAKEAIQLMKKLT